MYSEVSVFCVILLISVLNLCILYLLDTGFDTLIRICEAAGTSETKQTIYVDVRPTSFATFDHFPEVLSMRNRYG